MLTTVLLCHPLTAVLCVLPPCCVRPPCCAVPGRRPLYRNTHISPASPLARYNDNNLRGHGAPYIHHHHCCCSPAAGDAAARHRPRRARRPPRLPLRVRHMPDRLQRRLGDVLRRSRHGRGHRDSGRRHSGCSAGGRDDLQHDPGHVYGGVRRRRPAGLRVPHAMSRAGILHALPACRPARPGGLGGLGAAAGCRVQAEWTIRYPDQELRVYTAFVATSSMWQFIYGAEAGHGRYGRTLHSDRAACRRMPQHARMHVPWFPSGRGRWCFISATSAVPLSS